MVVRTRIRRPARRISRSRSGGISSSRPRLSVRKPGAISSSPATISIIPWASGRDGSRSCARLRCASCQAPTPWLRITTTPSTADSTTSASVAPSPIMPPTWMNSAISMIGRAANSQNSHMTFPFRVGG